MADEAPQSPENAAESRPTPRDDASYDGGSPNPWAPPADRAPADTVPSPGSPVWGAAPKVPLDKPASGAGTGDPVPPVPRADANPWAAPADDSAAAGSGDTAGPPVWGAAPKVPLDKPASGAGDPVPPAVPRADANPWAAPADGSPASGSGARDTVFSGGTGTTPPVSVHDRQTVTSVPNDPAPPAWGGPFAPPTPPVPSPFAPPAPASPLPGNPFAPPAGAGPYPQGAPVPPPPIAPDGPGQVPYGYPGGPAGYGYPAPPGYGGPGPVAHGAPAGYYGWPGTQPMPSNGMGTAGLVLGILAAICFCAWPLALVLGALGVIFGAIGRGKARRGEATNPGQSLAGIICGSVGIVLALVMVALEIANVT
ncbi:hypothetical protein ACIPSA_33725 [Streptomyces sp. NPDC086549]|uniref:hypothetical protein n=1 Tax=Streptomyces sp. NPDC086549 TaxID=3365752 RepID=UPI00380D544A